MDFYKFPKELVKYTKELWTKIIVGEYEYPPIPSDLQLRSLFEVAYLVGLETDESRFLKFSLCCSPKSSPLRSLYEEREFESWVFANDRPFTIQEIRRLAVTANLDTSAIWVCYGEDPKEPLLIHGLLNLGSLWSEARRGYSYRYDSLPHALLLRIEGPGKMIVYQGQYGIIELKNGQINHCNPLPCGDLIGIYPFFSSAQELFESEIIHPEYEDPKEWYNFEWTALINVILAIVNTIQLNAHGGALILTDGTCNIYDYFKIKYSLALEPIYLKERFLEYINLRHKFADMTYPPQFKKDVPPVSEMEIHLTSYILIDLERKLSETCKFIGNLSATDGAVILRNDFTVIGFGAEILLDKAKPSLIYRVLDPLKKEMVEGDSEEFGMRHRSAMRLCASDPSFKVFVVSQDGGISLIWNSHGKVCYLPGIKTTNANMVLA